MKLRPLIASLTAVLAGCGGNNFGSEAPRAADAAAGAGAYTVHYLVSDGSVPADNVDPDLKNPWGIAFNPMGPVWTANNRSQTSTLYDGTGAKSPLTVSIPAGSRGAADPTGIVYNASMDFQASVPLPVPASFIFSGEGGTLAAWSLINLQTAVTVYDDGPGGAVYKGLAIAASDGANFLYATDFHNAKVDVFDGAFARVEVAGGFRDAAIPAGYAPYGIQNIAGNLVVTYARQAPGSDDEQRGAGLGYVDLFDPKGQLLRRLASGGVLDAPWGVALAPADFGEFSGALLIGNFGDGRINAFDPATGDYRGALAGTDGQVLVLPGLWGIAFGPGPQSQPVNVLFFAAGVNGETGGAYGRIEVATPPPGGAATLSRIQSQTFSPKCASCHDGGSSSLPGSMNLSSTQASYDNLVNVDSQEVSTLKRVKPGDADNSYLVHKVEGTQEQGQRMPLGGLPLSAAEIADIRSWISAGAAND